MEIQQYRCLNISQDDEWNTQHIPTAVHVSQSYSAPMPPSSASSERIFSTAELRVSSKRSQLSPFSINKIIFINSVENLVSSDLWRCRRSLPFCWHRRRRSQLVGAPPPTHSDQRTLPTSYNACMHCVASFNFSTRGRTLWSLPKSLLSLGAAFWLSFKWMKCFPNLFVMLYMALLLQLVAQQELGRNSSSCPNQAAAGYPSKYSSQSMPEFLPV